MPTLDLGSGSGTDTINGITSYLDAGGSATRLLTSSFLGVIVSLFSFPIEVMDAVLEFVTAPFRGAGESISSLFDALLTAPANLIESGARISENSIAVLFGESVAGVLAFPLTVALALVVLFMIRVYLDEEETGNAIPFAMDIPDFLGGVDEEATDDQ